MINLARLLLDRQMNLFGDDEKRFALYTQVYQMISRLFASPSWGTLAFYPHTTTFQAPVPEQTMELFVTASTAMSQANTLTKRKRGSKQGGKRGRKTIMETGGEDKEHPGQGRPVASRSILSNTVSSNLPKAIIMKWAELNEEQWIQLRVRFAHNQGARAKRTTYSKRQLVCWKV
jgi:hypothetical protein